MASFPGEQAGRDEQGSASVGHNPLHDEAHEHAEAYEERHVHGVYEAIASHFSSTRHKPWPRVARFLLSQRPGTVGLDMGCGNGKYQAVNRAVTLLGSDRCASLVALARAERGAEAIVADGLALPFRYAAVDFAICVAVVHHFSSRARRRDAVAGLLACLRPGTDAQALIYVWALEQPSSRRGWDASCDQDALVPWVARGDAGSTTTYQRYYHLYAQGELEDDVRAVGGTVLESGFESDNWWVVCCRAVDPDGG
ncbi:hypothetical protein GQ602_006631 [Ophiocordyceps camponoti-floridani]|uniref:Methyltransferase type 11 domain-containing protein n=1 Tax=Ophiocordyceps camponoti-floridani TaxID=2030778 RepID=A0A8H4Q1J8_9HYPO|nr:hypothetical protein GQ602_006631 [Ophiocordyceps camponoti-floridani]